MNNLYIIFVVLTEVILAKQFQHRIVGGVKAINNQFPYQVSVEKGEKQRGYEHFCGGSILTPKYVLTAAHCIKGNYFRVRAGILRLDDSSAVGQTVKVDKIFIHSGYDKDHGDVAADDIAVLKLEKDLIYSDSIQPIKLPKSTGIPSGVAILSGWGRTNGSKKTYSNDLMYTELRLITLDECKQEFINVAGTYGPLNAMNFCTQEDGKFGCQGDSGGPLVQNGTVIGVVSFATTPCDIIGSPTAYSNVGNYLEWIKEQIEAT